MLAPLLWAGALGAGAPGAQARSPSSQSSVLLVFAPAGERELASIGGMSVGIMSASQGEYSPSQLLLDMTQGARVASAAYPHPRAPQLSLTPSGAGAIVAGWQAAQKRARDAPQLLQPGLLASRVPGGAGYVGVTGAANTDGALAADRGGRVARLSLGPASTLLERVARMSRGVRLVVASLPGGSEGRRDLRALSRARSPGELLLVVQRVSSSSAGELLWSAAAGLAGGGARELTSQSTNERGLIASFDVAPTILAHLGEAAPVGMLGKSITTDGPLHSSSLRALMARLRVIGVRRLKALAWLLCAWALLLVIAAPWARARAWAMRAGGLGVLWAPVAVLLTAALEPSAAVEYATIVLVCLGLGAASDALLRWPRALLAPALASVLALAVDALAGTQLLMRSLLGPDPILGARFYGFGNELKSGLAVLVLAGVAAALYPAVRGARAALAMAGASVILAVVEGSARIGAGVGGVILVSFGGAVAAVMLTPGALTRRRALIVLGSPIVGLVGLAAIDLATAHGSGHFTGSVLDARSASEVREIIVRRYSAAWRELREGAMPVASGVALACAGFGLRRRVALLAPVDGDPAWLAALAGGLAAGVVGALVEDSGPVLLVVAVFALGCVLSYLWGCPRAVGSPRVLGSPRAAGSPPVTSSPRRREALPASAPSLES